MTIVTVRDGKVTLRVPNAVVTSNGTVWVQGVPVINGKSSAAAKIGLDRLKELMRAKKFDEVPLDAYAKMGMNETGLEVLDAREYDERERRSRPEPTEAEKDYAEIVDLQRRAERRINDSDDDNVSDHFSMLAKVKNLMEAWRRKYPSESRKLDAQDLRLQAAKQRELAMGALTYDADGWIDKEGQQKRHDEFMNKALRLEKEAEDLEKQ